MDELKREIDGLRRLLETEHDQKGALETNMKRDKDEMNNNLQKVEAELR